MKFDANRVVQTVEQLGVARFTGTGGLRALPTLLRKAFRESIGKPIVARSAGRDLANWRTIGAQ